MGGNRPGLGRAGHHCPWRQLTCCAILSCLRFVYRFKAHKPLLEQHFSIVGDDGMSKEPQSGVLVKESESVYTLWCTGRQYCEGI